MNILRENIDELNAILTVQIEPADYESRVDKQIRDYRQKAQIKGFRPGQVPLGLIKKMIGKSAVVEEVGKILQESLEEYIKTEDLKILGEPLPVHTDHIIDWEKQSEFEFKFEIGLSPKIDVEFLKELQLKEYGIKVDESIIENEIKAHAHRHGEEVLTEVSVDEDLLKGTLTQLNADGEVLENGLVHQDALMGVHRILDEEIKKTFIGVKVGDTINFDISKAYTDNEDVKRILDIKDENYDATLQNPYFRFEVKEIKHWIPSEVNQELFDKVYGPGIAANEEEFKELVVKDVETVFNQESYFKFLYDTNEQILAKDVKIPGEFIKKLILANNADKPDTKITPEYLEKEFTQIMNYWKLELVKSHFVNEFKIEVTQDEVIESAKIDIRNQFRNYGITSHISDELLESYAHNQIKNKEHRKELYDKILDTKFVELVKQHAQVEYVEISRDDFYKMLEIQK